MQSLQSITEKPWQSAGVFLLAFFLSATFLHLIDFYPEPKVTHEEGEFDTRENEQNTASAYVATRAGEDTREGARVETPTEPTFAAAEYPTRIVIPRIGVNTSIENPAASDLTTLDNALLLGAVRYPGSALLGQDSTMFLFGHQSNLPVVRNPAFKAFNDLQKLDAGDIIRIQSATTEYQYRVLSVELVLAEEALIPLSSSEKRLILSTCNSFGDPGERYVVEAEFVGQKTL